MKKIPNKIKELYSAEGKESKKKMENMVILLIILIITCIAVNKIWNGDKKEERWFVAISLRFVDFTYRKP